MYSSNTFFSLAFASVKLFFQILQCDRHHIWWTNVQLIYKDPNFPNQKIIGQPRCNRHENNCSFYTPSSATWLTAAVWLSLTSVKCDFHCRTANKTFSEIFVRLFYCLIKSRTICIAGWKLFFSPQVMTNRKISCITIFCIKIRWLYYMVYIKARKTLRQIPHQPPRGPGLITQSPNPWSGCVRKGIWSKLHSVCARKCIPSSCAVKCHLKSTFTTKC